MAYRTNATNSSLKNIENRGWPINYRGDILIHAAKTCTKKAYFEAKEFCQGMGVVIPELKSLRRGQIIGIVQLSRWSSTQANQT
ncbi:MAG: hypothetical protein V7L11_25515 [Nostoc sp.]|uniref:hypothetical protein n=1 Tax=Nostoc sp. TaxID=1180 RepID=UPI002FFD2827